MISLDAEKAALVACALVFACAIYALIERLTRPAAKTVGVVSEIVVYPLKSARGVSVPSAVIGEHGLAFDRLWMVVDANGAFLSQRRVSKLAVVQVALPTSMDEPLKVRAPGMPPLEVPVLHGNNTKRVRVWDDRVMANDQGDVAAAWFEKFLDVEGCRLVRLADGERRVCDKRYGAEQRSWLSGMATPLTAFSDGFPLLLASEASLGELNRRLKARGKKQIPMNRFRPNIVIGGAAYGTTPFAEDGWARVTAGEAAFAVVKPCSRCKMPTIDQTTGVADGAVSERRRSRSPARSKAKAAAGDHDDEGGGPASEAEPTSTLRAFRSGARLGYKRAAWAEQVFFGQNLLCSSARGSGVRVGDVVHAVPRRSPHSIFGKRVKGVDF